jgi:acetoin utilization deacetylase AcuC-like enzyme
VRIFYTDHFELPLPEGHRFPMSKYRRLRSRIAGDVQHREDVLLVPPAADDHQLLTCHTLRYLTAVKEGTLSAAEIRRIGFPWSEKMVERSRRSSGATLAAARAAIGGEHIAVNLAGGTHHAMSDAGEGYCIFNDAAVTIRALQAESIVSCACVIDLDVHQGNGTAQITAGDDSIFTLSIHGEKNFPHRKYPSSLDIDLPDGTGDEEYLARLVDALDQVSRQGPFDLVVYLAGADPYVGDRLGRLGLSKTGLARRDETVLNWAAENRLPMAIAMAGGYAPDIEDIVDIHAATVGLASKFWQRLKNK